jgi:hypothetical protein
MNTIVLLLVFAVYVRGGLWGLRAAARRDAEEVAGGGSSYLHPGHTLFYRERAIFWTAFWPVLLLLKGLGALGSPIGSPYRHAFDAAKEDVARRKELEAERRHAEQEIDRIIREASL